MNDKLPPLPPEIAQAIKEANEVQRVLIEFNPADGSIKLQAPSNRMLAYGMIKLAEECLIIQSPLFNRPRIET